MRISKRYLPYGIIALLTVLCVWLSTVAIDGAKTKEAVNAAMLCGEVSDRMVETLDLYGIESRLVAVLTHEKPDGISDGHTMTEIMLDGRWTLYDPLFGYFYEHDGKRLNLDELIAIAKVDVTQIKKVYIGGELPETEMPYSLMDRIFDSRLIYDKPYFYTPSKETSEYNPSYYKYLEYKAWKAKFYAS